MDDHENRDGPPVAERVRDHTSVGANGSVRTRTPAVAAEKTGGRPVKQTRRRSKKRRRGRVSAKRSEPSTQPLAPVETVQKADAQAGLPQSVHISRERPTEEPVKQPQNLTVRPVERLYAALDLGTNNCRLLIAAPSKPGRFRVVDAFSRIVRLGEGLAGSGRLGDEAMERAIEALEICAQKLKGRKLSGIRMIATEACRSAENGAQFLKNVQSRTGLKLEIIDRRTEARLAVFGCSSLIGRDTDGVVLFDIGGGSSEIALVDLTKRRTSKFAEHIVAWTSLPVGVVSLAERFGGKDVTTESFEAMVVEVAGLLENFEGAHKLQHIAEGNKFHLLGTSGTVTTLAGVHLELKRYDRRQVDGLWLENENINKMIEKILGWSYDERRENPCIGAERADLVLAGCAILEAIRRRWPSERLRVADRGLREGMLNEMMSRDGVWRRRRSNRSAESK